MRSQAFQSSAGTPGGNSEYVVRAVDFTSGPAATIPFAELSRNGARASVEPWNRTAR
jgi:hypothetical protein